PLLQASAPCVICLDGSGGDEAFPDNFTSLSSPDCSKEPTAREEEILTLESLAMKNDLIRIRHDV
ncbi:MAG: hypothetical protein ACREQ3_23220, partial [Candidatus Binatia bacterium]